MSSSTILHADLDAFFASVEQRDDPALRGRPVLVGGGVVLACSYEAKACGVQSAMGGSQARRLCPDAVVVRPRFDAYVAASKAVRAVFDRTSPVVEPISIDEAFLDVAGLERTAGPPAAIAARLREEVRCEVGLPITVGVARTKALAKVASASAKPDGLLVVPPEGERAFLDPLPVQRLWGVGPATARRLQSAGLFTVADLFACEEVDLVRLLGRAAGRHVHALAHARDPRPVRTSRRRRTYGAQRALGRGARSPAELDTALVALVDRVTRRMRAKERLGRTVTLRLRFDDFTRASRSRTLASPTAASAPVLETARALLAASMVQVVRRGCTLIGITISGIEDGAGPVQLALPIDGPDRAAIEHAVDGVRDRFGPGALLRGALVGAGAGLEPWLQPGESTAARAGAPPDRSGAPLGAGPRSDRDRARLGEGMPPDRSGAPPAGDAPLRRRAREGERV